MFSTHSPVFQTLNFKANGEALPQRFSNDSKQCPFLSLFGPKQSQNGTSKFSVSFTQKLSPPSSSLLNSIGEVFSVFTFFCFASIIWLCIWDPRCLGSLLWIAPDYHHRHFLVELLCLCCDLFLSNQFYVISIPWIFLGVSSPFIVPIP